MSLCKRIAAGVALALLATGAIAQPTTGTPSATAAGAHRPGPFAAIIRIAGRLNLTPDQKTQLRSMLETARSQVKDIRQDSSLTPEQKREKLQTVMQHVRASFSALLTPEQHARLIQVATTPGPLAGIGLLHLTDTQQSEARAVMQKMRGDIKTVRENAGLAPEQKQQQVKQIRLHAERQFLALLTPDQLKLWQQMHPHWGVAGTTNG